MWQHIVYIESGRVVCAGRDKEKQRLQVLLHVSLYLRVNVLQLVDKLTWSYFLAEKNGMIQRVSAAEAAGTCCCVEGDWR